MQTWSRSSCAGLLARSRRCSGRMEGQSGTYKEAGIVWRSIAGGQTPSYGGRHCEACSATNDRQRTLRKAFRGMARNGLGTLAKVSQLKETLTARDRRSVVVRYNAHTARLSPRSHAVHRRHAMSKLPRSAPAICVASRWSFSAIPTAELFAVLTAALNALGRQRRS